MNFNSYTLGLINIIFELALFKIVCTCSHACDFGAWSVCLCNVSSYHIKIEKAIEYRVKRKDDR